MVHLYREFCTLRFFLIEIRIFPNPNFQLFIPLGNCKLLHSPDGINCSNYQWCQYSAILMLNICYSFVLASWPKVHFFFFFFFWLLKIWWNYLGLLHLICSPQILLGGVPRTKVHNWWITQFGNYGM